MDKAPSIGPGDGYQLYDELDSWDFFDDETGAGDGSDLSQCDFDSLREVANQLWMCSPFRW
jgi:hypothetical protein